jgi:histidinol-phosphate/aromatic aminotransferase/cobyric acid decarboxylase-like protein
LSNDIFATPFHNPSIHAVRERARRDDVIDFCVPANSYFPPPALLKAIVDGLGDILKYYPDYAPVHQQNLSRLVGTPAQHIVPANGVTELITLLCAGARGPILTDVPTFGRWTDLPLQHGTPLRTVARRPERDFGLSADEIVAAAREGRARTLVLCNPNNPTGACLPFEAVSRLVEALGDLDLVVIDESFIDFSGERSAESVAVAHDNVVVVKSLGKALGWHGIRLGYGVASAARAESLRARLPLWNINGLAGAVLHLAPAFRADYMASFAKVARDRDHMLARLRAVDGLRMFASKANFLLGELPTGVPGRRVRDRLLHEHGLFVRECGNKLGSSDRYLRFVVRKPSDADRLAVALGAVLQDGP